MFYAKAFDDVIKFAIPKILKLRYLKNKNSF